MCVGGGVVFLVGGFGLDVVSLRGGNFFGGCLVIG